MKRYLLAGILILTVILSGCSAEDNSEPVCPEKEQVLAMREAVLEGMSEEEIERLTENIKTANLILENAYLNDNIFGKLEDKDSLYWNYFDKTGEIQIGWLYNGDLDKNEVMEVEQLTEKEFYSKYGEPVMRENHFDAQAFISLIDDMKQTVNHEKLQEDLQRIMDETEKATETHEMEHANNIYKIVHDMDYYLLRYWLEDVGSYVRDRSTISKYYGVLSVYENID